MTPWIALALARTVPGTDPNPAFTAAALSDPALAEVQRRLDLDDLAASLLAVAVAADLHPIVARNLPRGIQPAALAPLGWDILAVRRALLPGAPLIRHRLVALDGQGAWRPSERAVAALLGEQPPLPAGLRWIEGSRRPPAARPAPRSFVGANEQLREDAALAWAGGHPLLVVEDPAPAPEVIVLEALLRDAAVLVACPLGADPAPDAKARLSALARTLVREGLPAAWSSASPQASAAAPSSWPVQAVPWPSQADARAAWADVVGNGPVADAMAVRFPTLSPRTLARLADEVGRDPNALARRAEVDAPQGLGAWAQAVIPTRGWDDLILDEPTALRLRELTEHARQAERVYDVWGGARVRPRGRGLRLLFAGPPGTGKTTAAEVVAGALGRDLHRIEVAAVVSRWVGETEKNLSRIFDAGDAARAVLCFDEADCLFGQRTEGGDAQDRYANQEIATLLQRLEQFEGVAILTTNLQNGMDEAFRRRFTAVVQFKAPGLAERRRLWRSALPARAPLADDVDVDDLAARFALSGAGIVNAALDAAFSAAAADRPIDRAALWLSIAREWHKDGRPIVPAWFGDDATDLRRRVA